MTTYTEDYAQLWSNAFAEIARQYKPRFPEQQLYTNREENHDHSE